MIWIVLGIISIFWDKPMGEYIPLIAAMLFGAFWSPIHPLLILVILYLHYLLGSGNGIFEILSMAILATVMMIEDLFYSKTFLYILYISSITLLVLMNFGIFASILALAEAFLIFKMEKSIS